MAARKSNLEIEIKLRVSSVTAGRRMLRRAGFRVRRRRLFESNVVYDTPDHALRRESKLLRLRQAGRQTLLTYKGPPLPGKHKAREEIEVRLPEAAAFEQILGRLGMEPCFRYEKYRTEYSRTGDAGVATVDETPIGIYIELEGPPAWIDATATQLGYGESDYITASYARLFQEFASSQADLSCSNWKWGVPPSI